MPRPGSQPRRPSCGTRTASLVPGSVPTTEASRLKERSMQLQPPRPVPGCVEQANAKESRITVKYQARGVAPHTSGACWTQERSCANRQYLSSRAVDRCHLGKPKKIAVSACRVPPLAGPAGDPQRKVTERKGPGARCLRSTNCFCSDRSWPAQVRAGQLLEVAWSRNRHEGRVSSPPVRAPPTHSVP